MATRINSRAKGQRAEREIIHILQPIIDAAYNRVGRADDIPRLERNQNQSAVGGYDIVGLTWLAPEIKNQATLAVDAWWAQCLKQAKKGQKPVLMWKLRGGKWRVRFYADIECVIGVVVDMDLRDWLPIFEDWVIFEAVRLDRYGLK